MDAVRWQRVKDLFVAAAARAVDGRAAFLNEACEGDADLRTEVQQLLDNQVNTGPLFDLVGVPPDRFRKSRDLTGSRLGTFDVTALIGRGGMGEVYRAHDTRLGRDVAIKVLPSVFTADAARLASFEREARVLASLNHPHIAAIHGAEERDGTRALVLELVDGETLADMLERSKASGRRGLPIEPAVSYARQIAGALEAAHSKGITHRDLKPANIAITPDGVIKLLDFGIATVVDGQGLGLDPSDRRPSTGENTQLSLIAGTPGYMSPEQARGGVVDQRTDIWAFGCVLFEILAGQKAFEGATPSATMAAVVDRDPDWSQLPRDTPRVIRRLVQRCLKKNPAERLLNIALARRELESLQRAGSRRWIAAGVVMAASIAAVAGLISGGERRPAGPGEWVQLTRFADAVGQPVLSPDNTMLAFVRGRSTFSTQGEIYVKRLPDGEPVALTHDGTTKMSPTFSPDGARIAYTVVQEGRWDTWHVSSAGGEARPWLENASGLTWAGPDALVFSEIKDKDIHMGVVASREDRTNVRDLYVPERASGMAHRSYVSPDGRFALIVEMTNGPWAPCRLVSTDGHSSARSVGPPKAGCTFAAWSPDGKWMYLTSSEGGGLHIWRQRFPDGKPEQITAGPTEQDGIAVSRDGRSFVTAVASRQSSVWVHGPNGERQISLEGFAFDPSFTPDGKKLVYRILKGASLLEASELRTTHLETGVTESLLPGITIYGTPSVSYALSPDGRVVTVSGFDAKGECKVWLAPLDGRSAPRTLPLTEAADLSLRGRSPDGRWVITFKILRDEVNGVTARALVAQPLAGQRELILLAPGAPTGLKEMALKWSRDGRTVFFVSAGLDRGQQTKTYAFSLQPGEMFPTIPPGGFRDEGELARAPGVTAIEGVYDVAPGPTPDVYAFTRESVQRNLYRVPLR